MIYICTVHYQTDKWIDIQLNYLKKFINEPFKTFVCLDETNFHHQLKFDYAYNYEASHCLKLNFLASKVIKHSVSDHDIIIFLDSDAFPINPLFPCVKNYITEHSLTAIQRLEDNGEPIAHPSFTACTIHLWKKINGTWIQDIFKDKFGTSIKDTGGKLFQLLTDHNIKWKPLLKSNNYYHHYTHFSIYENLIYHHGAGSRNNIVTRADREQFLCNSKNKMPFFIWKYIKILFYDYYLIKQKKRKLLKKQEEIFQRIKSDTLFYKAL